MIEVIIIKVTLKILMSDTTRQSTNSKTPAGRFLEPSENQYRLPRSGIQWPIKQKELFDDHYYNGNATFYLNVEENEENRELLTKTKIVVESANGVDFLKKVKNLLDYYKENRTMKPVGFLLPSIYHFSDNDFFSSKEGKAEYLKLRPAKIALGKMFAWGLSW